MRTCDIYVASMMSKAITPTVISWEPEGTVEYAAGISSRGRSRKPSPG